MTGKTKFIAKISFNLYQNFTLASLPGRRKQIMHFNQSSTGKEVGKNKSNYVRDFQQINYLILWGGHLAIGVKLRKIESCQEGPTN
ncbi:hypothetical protein [Nostoc sp.]|uniref:hypothetical protein n=1 Tax=Nostoc sp. TaxID=1180 RepID=UPI002FF68AF6